MAHMQLELERLSEYLKTILSCGTDQEIRAVMQPIERVYEHVVSRADALRATPEREPDPARIDDPLHPVR